MLLVIDRLAVRSLASFFAVVALVPVLVHVVRVVVLDVSTVRHHDPNWHVTPESIARPFRPSVKVAPTHRELVVVVVEVVVMVPTRFPLVQRVLRLHSAAVAAYGVSVGHLRRGCRLRQTTFWFEATALFCFSLRDQHVMV